VYSFFIHINKNKPCYNSDVPSKHSSWLYIIAAICGGQKGPELNEYPETELLRSEVDFRSLIWVKIGFLFQSSQDYCSFILVITWSPFVALSKKSPSKMGI